ncbi:MAG TPA: MaoC/PaaZ C-terminal domain-containing protein [Acidimicrobiia bacterium]|jgi:acyl dehydratase|nr:MaoC/PaaZ C-terminal domain-containing protein [Acidimicrobiia bacterium]
MTAFDTSALGRSTDEREFKVEAPRAIAYAAATNDTNERHTGGDLAPPVFAIVPVWDVMTAAAGLVTPPEAIERIVHSEQDMRFFRPIAPGDVLRSKAAPIYVAVRGVGTTVAIRTETTDAAGAPVNEQFVTLFFRGPFEGQSGGEPAPEHKLTAATKAGTPVAEVTYRFDEDQTFRYADASGDPVPIHLDAAAAQAVGLPGIIIHGLCTMAFCGRAVIETVAGGDPTRLARLAVKFSRPVFPDQEITVRIYATGDATYGFEALNAEGQAVVKDGLGELRA